MIAVNVNAGLANQMFHYAFGRGLMAKGLNIYFDQINFKPRAQWTFESVHLQDVFPNIDMQQMPKGHFKWVFPPEGNRFVVKFQDLMRRLHNFIGDETYIMETSYSYIDGMEKKATKNCIYRGFWQSEKYFSHCERDIRNQFIFLPFDEEKNIEISNKMSKENSVAIHFRKGKDYLRKGGMADGVCSPNYYQKAIEYIKCNVDSPVFYVFTDNVEWVRENIHDLDYILVDWNDISGKKNFRDMQLMSCAKHNIIGNSTYSWWGAWLNYDPNKIVIGPANWFSNPSPFFIKQDIICDSWIKM